MWHATCVAAGISPLFFILTTKINDFSQIMIDNSTFATLTAEYHTLGCKLNFSETGTMAQLLAEQGVRRAHGGETPDIVVVNTCSVTEEADRKCRALLRRLRRRYADALIGATGCYAQRAGDEVAKLPGVGVVLGSDRKRDVVEAVKGWLNERRQQIEVTAQGHDHIQSVVLAWRPHSLLAKGARWMRLLLLVLHHSACPWQKPQRHHRQPCCSGAAGGCRGRKGNCDYRREHWRFRQAAWRKVH